MELLNLGAFAEALNDFQQQSAFVTFQLRLRAHENLEFFALNAICRLEIAFVNFFMSIDRRILPSLQCLIRDSFFLLKNEENNIKIGLFPYTAW